MSIQTIQLKKEDEQKAVQEAAVIIQKVAQADTLSLDGLMDEMGKLGAKTQERAGATLKQLERPVATLMSGGSSQVSNLILSLRNECESLQQSKNVGFIGKLIRKSPVKNYVYKYQSVRTNIDDIVQGLRDGKDGLEESIVNMRTLKRSSLEEIYSLQEKIAMGNKLKELFETEIAKPENEQRKTYLERGLRKVVTRIQSMTEDILLFNQAVAATDIVNDNSDKLIDAVNNSIYKASNLITVSAMITLAIEDQLKIANAVESVNSTIEDQFKRNAELLKTSTEKSAELLKKPAMSLEAVNTAIADLITALDTSEKSNRDIIATCKTHTEKLAQINQNMSKRLGLETGGQPQASITSGAAGGNDIDRLLS